MLDPDAKKFCKFTRLFTSIYDCKTFLQNFSTGSKPLMQVPDALGGKNISKYCYCPIYPEMVLAFRYQSFVISFTCSALWPCRRNFCKTLQQDVNILAKPIWYKYQLLPSHERTLPLSNRPIDFRKNKVLQFSKIDTSKKQRRPIFCKTFLQDCSNQKPICNFQ